MTLQNEFTRALAVGAEASYGLTDWLAIGVWGAYSVAQLDTGLTDQVSSRGVTTDRNRLSLPSRGGFDNQIGNINWFTSLHLTFVPLRGKLSFFQKLFVDTDFYVFAGAAIVGIEERANVRRNNGSTADLGSGVCGNGASISERDACLVDSQSRRASRAQVAPTFGAGLSMYFNDFIGLTVEWRGMPFAWNTSGTDERGPDGLFPDSAINYRDQIRHFNHMVSLGLIIYLPTAAEITD
jgi:outer membrane beta-barrel protein